MARSSGTRERARREGRGPFFQVIPPEAQLEGLRLPPGCLDHPDLSPLPLPGEDPPSVSRRASSGVSLPIHPAGRGGSPGLPR